MTIKQQGGIFGRNPTFNDVDVEGTLTVGGSAIPSPTDILTSSDVGVTVQGYDVDTAKLDVAQTFTAEQTFNNDVTLGSGSTLQIDDEDSIVFGTFSNGSSGTLLNGGTSSAYLLYVGGKLRMSVDTSGNLDMSATNSGNIILKSGNGIDFSATSGTGTSELFDDYEEGIYTATATPNTSGSVTLETAYDTLSYTKVGRMVTINGEIRVASVSSPVGTRLIINLPFTVLDLTDAAGRSHGVTYAYLGSVTSQPFRCPEGNSQLWLDVDCSTLSSGNEFGFSFSYPAS